MKHNLYEGSESCLTRTLSIPPQVDILHPLVAVDWVEGAETPFPGSPYPQCVLLHDKLYASAVATPKEASWFSTASYNYPHGHDTCYRLHAYTPNLDCWEQIHMPIVHHNQPFIKFWSLATYRGQLVLVGGLEILHYPNSRVTNKLIVSEDGIEWDSAVLPPMPTRRFSALSVNTGSPEYLVVMGGYEGTGSSYQEKPLRTVEVLVKEHWSSIQPLPQLCTSIRYCVHANKLFLMGGESMNYRVLYCKMESLIRMCELAGEALVGPTALATPNNVTTITTSTTNTRNRLWSRLHPPHFTNSTPASFGWHLVACGGCKLAVESKVYAYCELTGSWVHVEDLPLRLHSATAVVLPGTRELLVMGGKSKRIMRGYLRGKVVVMI